MKPSTHLLNLIIIIGMSLLFSLVSEKCGRRPGGGFLWIYCLVHIGGLVNRKGEVD